MTIQKAIDSVDEIRGVIEIAFEVLKKQKTMHWEKDDCEHVECTAFCPICGYDTYWSNAEDFRYCPRCGQALTTEDET